jgi:23S rRNA (adenine2503-C2)-methyltransferase
MKLRRQPQDLYGQARGEPFRAKPWRVAVEKFPAATLGMNNNISVATRELHGALRDKRRDGAKPTARRHRSAFKLAGGNVVEGVLIPHDTRMGNTISSRPGCSLTMVCATGYMDPQAQSRRGRIYDQNVVLRIP